MVTLVVILAAMFTVTGAMISVFGSGGATAPPDQGKLDGQYVRYTDFNSKRRALGIIFQLDRSASPSSPDAPEHLYARVPTMSTRADRGHSWPYNAVMPRQTSLLEVWPNYQDQHVWCHILLAKRAREAGIEEPSNVYLGRVITALMNEHRSDIEKFEQRDLPARFSQTFGAKLDDYWLVFKEAVMIRDYVESLVARERASLKEVQVIAAGNYSELKAEYLRLKVDYFMDEARRDVRNEHFQYRSANQAARFGIGTIGSGYDRFEEAYDKNRARSLQSEATFGFDVIKAYPAEMIAQGNVRIDDSLLKLIYEAVRDEMFQADEEEKQAIEPRLEEAADDYQRENPDETRDWTEADWNQWKSERRDEYLEYLSFSEAKPELVGALEEKESLRAAQASMAGLMRFIETEKQKRERQLRARLEVIRKEQAIWEGLEGYLRDLGRRFDSLETELFRVTRDAANRVDSQATGTDEERNAAALDRIVDDIARELGDLDSRQVQTILTTARAETSRYERTLNDKRAEMEEFELEEEHRTDNGELMTQEEVDARLEQFRLEIRAIEEKIKLRDAKVKLVEDFVDDFRDRLSRYEVLVRNAREGEIDLRRRVLLELLHEIPLELSARVREQRGDIVPEDESEEYKAQAELIRADYEARNKRIQKEAADTRDWNLTVGTDESQSIINRFGLGFETVAGTWTWERLIADERYRYLENIDGARSFLEEPANAAGATSGIMTMPGRGYLMLRLKDKSPKHPLGRVESHDKVVEIAGIKRARELAVDALKELRREILDKGWDSAVADAKRKYGEHFSVAKTPWFNDSMDLPGVFSSSDTEILDIGSSPSSSGPDQPFMSRIKDIKPHEGVTELIPEQRNQDPLRRPEAAEWAYLIARVIDRRQVPRRLSTDDMMETNWGGTPAEIWRHHHLATSKTVRNLVTPSLLLEGHEIIQYKIDEPDEDGREEE